MNSILDKFFDAIRSVLESIIRSNLEEMFTDVNEQVGTITSTVAQTPSSWDANVFNLIRTISDNVIMPIAGIIISFVLVYELLSMVVEKNSMQEVGIGMIARYLLKACLAVMILSHTFDFTMAVFDVGNHVITRSGAIVTGSTRMDVSASLVTLFENSMEGMDIGQMFIAAFETMIMRFAMNILSILIIVILYVRLIEIYLYISISPIPYATCVNKEWGSIGTNYIRGLFALAFQGFFIIICVAIYAVIIARLPAATDLSSALFKACAATIALGFTLFRTGGISKAIFNAR